MAQLDADERSLKAKFEEPLRIWAQAEAERRRRKTVTLVDANLCLRSVPARFVVADGAAALNHAAAHLPACIVQQTIVTLDKAAYLAQAETVGELRPGVDHQPAYEKFAIRFPGVNAKEATEAL